MDVRVALLDTACLDCSKIVLEQGVVLCDARSFRRLIARRLAAQANLVRPAWERAIYDAFQHWDDLPRNQYGVDRQAAAYARVSAAIGVTCEGPGEVTHRREVACALFEASPLAEGVADRDSFAMRLLKKGHVPISYDKGDSALAALGQRHIDSGFAGPTDPWQAPRSRGASPDSL